MMPYFNNRFAETYGLTIGEPEIFIPLKAGGSKWGDNELRYCLRAIAKHLPGRKVHILTDVNSAPSWLKTGDMLQVSEAHGYVQAIRVAVSLAMANEHQHYLWWNDDIFLLKDSTLADFAFGRHAVGHMVPGRKMAGNMWRRKLALVRDTCDDFDYSPVYDFSTHTPYLFHAPSMLRVLACVGASYKTPIETAYFNMMRAVVPKQRCLDKITFYAKRPVPDTVNARFLNLSDRGLGQELKGFLKGRFHEPSVYEQA